MLYRSRSSLIKEKLIHTIKQNRLITTGEKLVIGVSGGPDSVALLYLLNSLKEKLDLELHVAHLDHMLRKDSYKDSAFVETLAKRFDLPITLAKINLKALLDKGSTEEIARNARLGFLFQVANKIGAKKIALGHNFDDQAETVLMRILRGSGLYGLSGILPKRDISGYQIIRPLIEITRKEIEAFLRSKKITPRIDKTNLEDLYMRNKIRNRLLPLLKKEYNTNIQKVLVNLAQSSGADYDYLTKSAQSIVLGKKNKLSVAKLVKLHPAMRRLILRQAIIDLQGSTRRIDFQHIKELEDLIFNRPVNSIVDLPKRICVIKKKKLLCFLHK